MDLPVVAGFVLRPLGQDDAGAWAAYACLPEVKQHTSSTAESVADVRAVIERTLAANPDAPIRFGLFAADGGELLASVGFHRVRQP